MKFGLRFFMFLTTGVMAFAAVMPAHAADMLSTSGHARTRFMFSDNTNAVESNSNEDIRNRVRLNLDVTPSKALMVRIAPEFTNTWGTAAAGDNTNPNFTAFEAWMSWKASDAATFFLGRQALSYGNELFIGTNEWGQNGRTFDAARVRLTYDMGWTDVIYSKIVEGSTPATTIPDHDLFGFYTGLDTGNRVPMVNGVDLYAFWDDNRNHGANRNRFASLGARLHGDINRLDYNVEVTGQFGKRNSLDVKGFQADLTVGADLMRDHHVALDFAYANTEYQDMYSTGHKFLGMADIINRLNVMAIALMTNWKLSDKFTATLDAHYFMKAKDDFNTGTTANTTASGKRPLGMEGDLVLTYTPEKMLAFDLGYFLFKPLSAMSSSTLATRANKVNHQLYLQGTLTF